MPEPYRWLAIWDHLWVIDRRHPESETKEEVEAAIEQRILMIVDEA